MTLIIRNIPAATVSNMDAEAERQGMSRQALIADLLEKQFGRQPAVIGWIRLDRWGDLDERDEPTDPLAVCPTCDDGVYPGDAWLAAIADGRVIGPYCGYCATSE